MAKGTEKGQNKYLTAQENKSKQTGNASNHNEVQTGINTNPGGILVLLKSLAFLLGKFGLEKS